MTVTTIPVPIPSFADLNKAERKLPAPFELYPDFHYEYKAATYTWFLSRCAVAGESTIKNENDLFLPIPASMLVQPEKSSSETYSYATVNYNIGYDTPYAALARRFNPNYHLNKAYMSYKTRAQFPELTSYTLRGLLGLVIKSLPTVHLPTQMEYLKENVTRDGKDLNTLFLYTLAEVLITGRLFLLADISEDGTIKIVPYTAEAAINWRSEESGSDDSRLYEIILEEATKVTYNEVHRELLQLVGGEGNMPYQAIKYQAKEGSSDFNITKSKNTPNYKGKKLNYIPGVMVGANDLTPAVDKAPLSGISRTAVQIYQVDADLRQAEFMTCNPTLVMTGVDEESVPQVVGSTIGIAIPDPAARVFYTETDTSALSHMNKRISDLNDYALQQGASLLGGQRNVSESGEALRIRQASTSATLVSVTYVVGSGIEKVLKYIANWMGLNADEITFEPNTEFTTYAMTAQEQLALVNSWKEGALSDDTLLDNFRKAGMLQAGDTIEDEKKRGGGQRHIGEGADSTGFEQRVAGIVGGSTRSDVN